MAKKGKVIDTGQPFLDIEEDRPSGLMPLIDNCTEDGKTIYGFPWKEITNLAIAWWDTTGRHVVRNPEFQNPDIGFKSGLLRGLHSSGLTRRETLRIVHVYERTQLRPYYREAILDWMRRHHPDWLLLKDERLNEWVPEDVRAEAALKQVVDAGVEPDKLN